MTDRDLMQQALDALEYIYTETTETEDKVIHAAITALRDRLAKPHIKVEGPLHVVCQCDKCKTQRPWVGLTKKEAKEISMANRPYVIDMIAALEARLKEKNT